MASEQPLDQSADPKFRPPEWMIPWITKANVWIYKRSNGKYGADGGGMENLLLSMVGRRSGNPQTVALPYWYDTDGSLIVVASFGGAAKHPAWFHNVRDTDANPTVTVQIRDQVSTATTEVLSGEVYSETWARLTADRPNYARYQARTDRTIPLVRLRLDS